MSVFSEHVWLEPCFWVVMVVNLHIIFHKVQKSLREFRVLGALSFFVDEIGRLSESFAELDTRSTKRLHLNQKFSAENVRVVIQPKETEALNLFGHYTLAPLQERKPVHFDIRLTHIGPVRLMVCLDSKMGSLDRKLNLPLAIHPPILSDNRTFKHGVFKNLHNSVRFHPYRHPTPLHQTVRPSTISQKEQNCSHNISRGRTYLIYTIPLPIPTPQLRNGGRNFTYNLVP
jgi:hypothetical protein